MSTNNITTKHTTEKIKNWADGIRKEISTVFLGKDDVIDLLLTAVLSRGHILLEDIPGVGKTIVARAVAACLGGRFGRIQCTPDLLPADVTGYTIVKSDGSMHFQEGPVQNNILLVDEINRATPRTQSALLEAMAEGQITVEGRQLQLPDPFFVIATENPVEFEGTFPLPEAQRDRFLLSISVGYPDRASELQLMDTLNKKRHPVNDLSCVSSLDELLELQELVFQVFVSPEIREYIMDLCTATRRSADLRLGVSPRGSQALFRASQAIAAIRGRSYVIPEDVKDLAPAVFRQRVLLGAEQLVRGLSAATVVEHCIESVALPVLRTV